MRLIAALICLTTTGFAAFASAQTPPRCTDSFNLYFESETAIVPDSAKGLVVAIVERIKKCPASRILVIGHVDGFETRFLPKLGADRSAVVAANLLRQMPLGARVIVTDAGYSRPARVTALGIKEPLNRRVTIEMQ